MPTFAPVQHKRVPPKVAALPKRVARGTVRKGQIGIPQPQSRSKGGALPQPVVVTPVPIRAKLEVSQPGDDLEQEADRVAERVMRMPLEAVAPTTPRQSTPLSLLVQRVCSSCTSERSDGKEPVQRALDGAQSPRDPGAAAGWLQRLHQARASGGEALPLKIRQVMEPRFGASFDSTRVHHDSSASSLARDISARAFTTQDHVFFKDGEFMPTTERGQRLLAHELAHVVQQRSGLATWGREPSFSARVTTSEETLVQRQPDAAEAQQPTAADRSNDPQFLTCLILCYLGIPPNLWRTVLNYVLSASIREFRARLGELKGSEEFEKWRAGITVWSDFNKLKLILGFLGESRISVFTIKNAAAVAIRRQALARLATAGVGEAALATASQIARKIAVFIEVAVAAGCATYCGATQLVNSILEFSEAAASALSSFVAITSRIAGTIGNIIAKPILIARAILTPTNWDLSALPARSRPHINVIGGAFLLSSTPDTFLADVARPLSSFGLGAILAELAEDVNTGMQQRGGFAQLVTFTPQVLARYTPIQLVNILKDYGLLKFIQSPEVLADKALAAQAAEPSP